MKVQLGVEDRSSEQGLVRTTKLYRQLLHPTLMGQQHLSSCNGAYVVLRTRRAAPTAVDTIEEAMVLTAMSERDGSQS